MKNKLDWSASCLVTLLVEVVIAIFLCPLGIMLTLVAQLAGIPLLFGGPVAVLVILGMGWAILRGIGK